MAKGAYVGSVESVQELLVALLNFIPDCRELIDEGRTVIECGSTTLEARRDAWKQELRYRQQEYDSADSEEDDLHYLSRRIEEAETELAEVKRWCNRVNEAKEEYDRRASRVLDEQNEKAIAFLRNKISEMQDYLTAPLVQIEHASPQQSGILSNIIGAGESLAEMAVVTLTDHVLPLGFEWIPISSINSRDMAELPTDDDFRKVPKEEMQRGLFILRRTVLPALDKEGTNANSDFFREIDQRAGQSHEQGALRVYEAFFGTDHIHLGRSPDSKHYDIDNGRHRIKVAQELGWTHIPVKK